MGQSMLRLAASVTLGLGLVAAAQATTIIQQDTRSLVRTSSDIVVGKIATVRSHWNASHTHIVTDVEVEISQSLKGAQQRLTLTQLGGEVDGMRLTVPGCPTFKPGQEALFFVWRDAKGLAQVNGLSQGKFDIRRDPVTHVPFIGREVPGMAFGDARSLRPLRTGEAPPRVSLARMLEEIRSELASSEH